MQVSVLDPVDFLQPPPDPKLSAFQVEASEAVQTIVYVLITVAVDWKTYLPLDASYMILSADGIFFPGTYLFFN